MSKFGPANPKGQFSTKLSKKKIKDKIKKILGDSFVGIKRSGDDIEILSNIELSESELDKIKKELEME